MESSFDVLVIGAGPGGYVCAFRAAQLGLRVGLVEKRATLGGTCLNVGCIPSKALLHSTEHLVFARSHAAEHGIRLGAIEVDLATMLKRKDSVVSKLTGGVAQLAKGRKITVLTGTATFAEGRTVVITPPDGGAPTRVQAANIVIATGSVPVELPFLRFNGETVVSSDEAIRFPTVPKRLVVVGGGAIGLELGSVWSRLGSEVTVVEFLPKVIATYDDDVVRAFTRILQKQGLRLETGAKVTGFANGVLTAERGGEKLEFPADRVLVAVGRRACTEGLGLDRAGVALDERGRIRVDGHLRTNVPGIWAVGDVVAGPMLAHKAEEDGVAVAEWIAQRAGPRAGRGLHVPGGGFGGPRRGRREGRRPGRECRQVQPRRERARAVRGQRRGLREDHRRCQDGPHPRRADPRGQRRRTDQRGGHAHDLRRQRRGLGADDSRAPDGERGGA
jgi:dihydrolipoamide dehydrogenase